MGMFLGPCILAIAGAACFGESHAAQLSGAVAGLVAGMIGSVAVAKLLDRGGKAEATRHNP